ncbi:structural protein [Cyanophage S-RIM32]|uniref:Structural protein n=1 Tax=Cyanophage S-RIM32 TaxID=1278479 RepID=A0A127KM95_9CAUD|nr:virion structural protein [Cyanophage S-RIM32]AMO43110.1 structural protein [Cyanophage S-RIM32]
MAETRRISTLIETQLPEFISSDYENFSKVLEKYYEQLELRGQPLDVIQNITKYRDIDFYEQNLLNENTKLASNAFAADTTITVEDATSFPEQNGYIKIGEEILFYKERTSNQFLEVSRGVSGNTKLGDLYDKSNFVTTLAADHYTGDNVQNISNLFLYAIVRNFESDYLASFPEKYLKSGIDKRTLIKNISSFYQAKGTDRSIKFIFNTLVSNETPEVVKPKDFTLKSSTSDWVTSYSLKVKVLSGDPSSLVGQEIIQALDAFDSSLGYASAIVDNVFSAGVVDGEQLYQISLDTSTVNNFFAVSAKTEITETFAPGLGSGGRINVFSTQGFKSRGRFLIGSEEFRYNDKNVNQFVIESREGTQGYSRGTNVYSYSTVTSGNAKLLVLGVLYNLNPSVESPYSEEGDFIEISDPGFVSRDPIVTDVSNNSIRWILSNGKASSNSAVINSQINDLNADVSAIYEDSNYFYICSSSYPSRNILSATTQSTLSDQKVLRLIRKNPQTITETYPTSQRDVGIFVDGTLAFSNKDFSQVTFGPIEEFKITSKGFGYLNPPNVLINDKPGKARVKLAGETVDRIESLDEVSYSENPSVTITSGRGARASAIVTFGRITSIVVVDSGEYYSTPPVVRIVDRLGRGRFAEYNAILEDGKVVDFEVVDEGKFYTRGEVIVDILSVGAGATADASITTWTKDRYNNLQSNLDASNGYAFPNYNPVKGFGYGICANPTELRNELGDTGTNHSPVLGYAYDGNPIYGPYGFSNPLDSSSSISRLSSGYSLKTNRIGGPTFDEFPLGTFIEDYEWKPSTLTGKLELDENNGRYCVTPEYQDGVYAYFITVDDSNNPKFPYILGSNFYSLPVDSNYNADLSQDDIPKSVKRLRTVDTLKNGGNSIIRVDKTSSGSVTSLDVEDSPNTFKVGNAFVVSDVGTEGSGAGAIVSEVTGKPVSSLDSISLDPSNNFGVSLVRLISSTYLFENDIITQQNSDFTGRVIGDVFNRNEFVIDQVTGTYKAGEVLDSSSNIINIIMSDNGVFTKGFTLLLTDGDDDILATGTILESTTNQNSVKVEVLSGVFEVPESTNKNYFLQSTNLGDDVGLQVVTYNVLSKNLVPFSVNNNIALLKTSEKHGVGVGSEVNVDIIPDESQTTTTYYVRKRFYQTITLKKPSFISLLNDTGVARVDLLNGGLGYTANTYNDVELIFFDQSKVRNGIGAPGDANNARATIVVSDFTGTGYGSVSQITITTKGSNYIKGDTLTVADASLVRNLLEISTQRLALNVDHVGFSRENTELKLVQVNKLSENDFLQIDSEVVKIESINSNDRTVTVLRGQEGTSATDHFDKASVSLYNGIYRFNENSRPLGDGLNDPYVIDYDENTQIVTLAYNYGATNPREVTNSSIFQDNSSPRKSISISASTPGENKLEFSKDQTFASYDVNTDIRIQKYYRYLFDTSHVSMNGIFLDFSASRTGSIFTEEKEVSGIQPGNPGSYVAITLGFGPNIVGSPQRRFPVNFDTYYYFIKASNDVNTDNAALKVIDDPLVGPKTVIFATPTKFAYEIPETPDYIGTGQIVYTTNSPFAEGKIYSTTLNNLGSNYKRLPILKGCFVSNNNAAVVTSEIDTLTGKVISVKIQNRGQNYVVPKAIITNADGTGADFEVLYQDGKISNIKVVNGGSGYTYPPTIEIYESSVKGFFKSSSIGVPRDISIINNGGSFHTDESILSTYRSHYALVVKNTDKKFFKGERVEQRLNGNLIFNAIVSDKGWRVGSNILRLSKTEGVIDLKLPLKSALDPSRYVEVSEVLFTEFEPDIKGYYDNLGRYTSDKGKIGSRYQKITDSYYYQDYSYVIQSFTPIDVWRDLIKQTTHPAGFQLFGEVLINSEQEATMPTVQTPTTSISYIELSPKTVTTEYKSTKITNSFVSVATSILRRGVGSISIDEYDTEGIIARELIIEEPFTGRYATKEDFVGSIRAITKAGSDSELRAAYTSWGGSSIVISGEFAHWIKFKMISNSDNQPAIAPFVGAGSPAQSWDGNDNYNIFSNDEYVTTGSGVFDLTKIQRMEIGYQFNFGEFSTEAPAADASLAMFGAFILSNEPDINQITSGFEVGDRITFYENAASYVTVEVVAVDAPAYDVIEGVIGNGNILGRKSFTLKDKKTKLPYSPYNEQELFLTLNGIAQEPGKAFKVSGSQITFSEAPLGPLFPQTGQNLDDTYETEAAKLVCKAFRFKDDAYNARYLRKLKDLSPQFDGIANSFDLYWEDGSIVKADPGEKFLVFINGILQEAKEDSDSPLGNAYYIDRRPNQNEPDAIVFSEAPRNFVDDIDTVPVQLDQRESFFGYGVGSYDRFKIDNNLIPYRGVGPYLVFGEVDNRVKNITDDRFILVFVDGVLQNPNSYILNGPNLTFLSPIKKYTPETGESTQNRVRLISLYGRDVPKTLSFYDFDRVGLTNEITLTINRVIDDSQANAEYLEWQSRLYSFNPSKPKLVYTVKSDGSRHILGKLSIARFDELADGTQSGILKVGVVATKFKLTLLNAANINFENLSYNPLTDTADDSRVHSIYVTDRSDFSNSISFNEISKAFSIDISYRIDDEGKRLLSRDLPEWIRNSELGNKAYYSKYEQLLDIQPGDEILVDGESEYRTIEYIPGTANLRNFGINQTAKYEHYTKVDVTNYNGLVRGEGLSITTQIDGSGRISSLGFSDLEWNKRDLKLFFDTGILLQPTAYQYFVPPQVKFVPVDGNGGGARAEVLTKDGQILDVVLIDGGYGYTQPPKAVVTRGYVVKKKTQRIISSEVVLQVQAERAIDSIIKIQSEILLTGEGTVSNVFSIIAVGGFAGDQLSSDDQWTTIVQTAGEDSKGHKLGNETRPVGTQIFTKREATGAFDQIASQLLVNERVITCTVNSVQSITTTQEPETVSDVITTIIHKQINTPVVYVKEDSYSTTGAFLDSPLSPTATTVYVLNTTLFPSNGKLQIGREIVSYEKTLTDRFYEVTRGIDGTEAQAHPAGQYLRTLPTFVTVLPVGPSTIVITESAVRMTDAKLVELKSQIVTEQEIKSSDERYVEIENEFQIETFIDTTVTESSIRSIIQPVDQSVTISTERDIQITNTIQVINEVKNAEESYVEIENEFQILTPKVEILPEVVVSVRSILAPSETSITNNPDRSIQVTTTLAPTSSDVRMREDLVERNYIRDYQIVRNIPDAIDADREILIIPPTTYLDGSQSSSSYSSVTEVVASVSNITSDSVKVKSVERFNQIGINIDVLGEDLQVQTEITKFDGFKTQFAFSTVLGTYESIVNVSASPTVSQLGALTTHTVSETVINLRELSNRVDFPRTADGGVLGGNSESGPSSFTSLINLYGDADVRTHSFIETNINLRVNGISSTYNVASELPIINGRSKPADVSIQREMGIIDYFEELVVLETSIKTRN